MMIGTDDAARTLPAELGAVHVGQTEIEQHEVGTVEVQQRVGARRDSTGGEAGALEALDQRRGDGVVVLDDQQVHGSSMNDGGPAPARDLAIPLLLRWSKVGRALLASAANHDRHQPPLRAAPAERGCPQPPRRAKPDRAWDVGVVVAANAAVTVGLWLRHGGLDTIGHPGGPMIAAGQLTGLLGTYAVLVELLLMSRIGWLERHLGFDRLAVWHRWVGFASVALLSAHAVCITLGYAAEGGQSIPAQLGDFVQHYPDVLMAIVGLRAVRCRRGRIRAGRPPTALTRGLVRVASVRLPGGRALVRASARSGDGLHR